MNKEMRVGATIKDTVGNEYVITRIFDEVDYWDIDLIQKPNGEHCYLRRPKKEINFPLNH